MSLQALRERCLLHCVFNGKAAEVFHVFETSRSEIAAPCRRAFRLRAVMKTGNSDHLGVRVIPAYWTQNQSLTSGLLKLPRLAHGGGGFVRLNTNLGFNRMLAMPTDAQRVNHLCKLCPVLKEMWNECQYSRCLQHPQAFPTRPPILIRMVGARFGPVLMNQKGTSPVMLSTYELKSENSVRPSFSEIHRFVSLPHEFSGDSSVVPQVLLMVKVNEQTQRPKITGGP